MGIIAAACSAAVLWAYHIAVTERDSAQNFCIVFCKSIGIYTCIAISEYIYIRAEKEGHIGIQLIAVVDDHCEHLVKSLCICVNSCICVHIYGVVQLCNKVKAVICIRVTRFIFIVKLRCDFVAFTHIFPVGGSALCGGNIAVPCSIKSHAKIQLYIVFIAVIKQLFKGIVGEIILEIVNLRGIINSPCAVCVMICNIAHNQIFYADFFHYLHFGIPAFIVICGIQPRLYKCTVNLRYMFLCRCCGYCRYTAYSKADCRCYCGY